MLYYSLNKISPSVDFRQATLEGQAPDRGLYFPVTIPAFPKEFIRHIESYSREEIAFRVMQPYVGDTIPETALRKIVQETISFDMPVVRIAPDVYALELFHGPTLAFKDVGARFMSRCLGHFVHAGAGKVTVLVATSGDTGGAVANGFHGIEGIQVVILYPSGKVSKVQELQLTTLGENVTALEINGSFDDCQDLVKQAFGDDGLKKEMFLTSANSINVARWLPQQLYYLFAWQQWPDRGNPPVFSVPSGNFGNICAGLLAYRSGLPVSHFIAACNANAVVPEFLQTGLYRPRKAVPTLSNAMDVGNPSNFVRVLELFDKELKPLANVLSSYSFSDGETVQAIRDTFAAHQYLTDPHGAVGLLALQKWQKDHPGHAGIFLETAHPVKFYDVVEPIIDQAIPLPPGVGALFGKKKISVKMDPDYKSLREFLSSLPR